MEGLLLVFMIVMAILFVGFCLVKTTHNKRKRIITGIVLLLSVFVYPMLVPFFGEFGVLDGVASLMAFHFILLIGGLITLVVGFFTKPEPQNFDS